MRYAIVKELPGCYGPRIVVSQFDLNNMVEHILNTLSVDGNVSKIDGNNCWWEFPQRKPNKLQDVCQRLQSHRFQEVDYSELVGSSW